MKKLSIFACVLAFAGLAFTSCGDGNQAPDLDNVIEDGFYCVGPATAVDNINASTLAIALMGQGTNEAEKEANGGVQVKRAGMYEKYIALEADKEFSLVLHKAGQSDVVYGAKLEETDAISDNAEITIKQFKGLLKQDTTMKVATSGLYHIILDLDEDGKLASMGGPQIVLVLCEWGLRGDLNGWDYTAMDAPEFNKTQMVYTIKNVEVKTNGSFKFAHSHCWKFNLDMSGAVKAENSIGTDADENGGAFKELLAGGKNIPIERGIYDITLTWNLKGGAMAKSFTYTATKTADVEIQDYSNCEMELVGSAVASTNAGAVEDASSWKWGNVLSIGKPTREGDVFTWKKEGVSLIGGEKFKVRTPNAEAQGDIAAFDNGTDVAVAATDVYTVTFTLDAASGDKKVKLEGSVPAEKKDITVTGIVPADWDKCYLWAWGADGDFFAGWPGQELPIVDGKVSYTFSQVTPPVNVIFSCPNKGQTKNLEGITENSEFNISENLQ